MDCSSVVVMTFSSNRPSSHVIFLFHLSVNGGGKATLYQLPIDIQSTKNANFRPYFYESQDNKPRRSPCKRSPRPMVAALQLIHLLSLSPMKPSLCLRDSVIRKPVWFRPFGGLPQTRSNDDRPDSIATGSVQLREQTETPPAQIRKFSNQNWPNRDRDNCSL